MFFFVWSSDSGCGAYKGVPKLSVHLKSICSKSRRRAWWSDGRQSTGAVCDLLWVIESSSS